MKYTPPIGGEPNDPYIDANPAVGVDGSVVPAAAIECPQREIVAAIEGFGGEPAADNMAQLIDLLLASLAPITGSADQVFRAAPAEGEHDVVTLAQVAAMLQASGPTGSLIYVPTSTAPAGYLKANGAAVSRTTYAALFAVIGTMFGAGNGSTTFNLPDERGLFPRAWDDGAGIDTGRALGSTQLDQLQNITGSIAQVVTGSNTQEQGVIAATQTEVNVSATGSSRRFMTLDIDASRVARAGAETRPRNRAWLACIKY